MAATIDTLRAMLDKEPGDPFLLYALAQAYAKAGDHPRAVEHYDHALQADPASFYSYFHKAISLRALGRQAEALAVARSGAAAARSGGDQKAFSELMGLADELE